ncbi:cofilin [Pseudovirgaria hyperparasitica]|uniref:Cofilin n=1 Tax=Pseudovirgaria hyperparasitica TaxID=470096 RepID=A0A6A6W1P6_9PEZI|nr:cofilin [Pseudovirgaria hyperparasitica]KAF2755996.1 cofilin [Pseudovirgaria hyperparasitica]
MAQSGIKVAAECVTAYEELKSKKAFRFILFKISDDGKEIVVDETGKEDDWDVFREKLISSKSKDKRGKEGVGARYAVYDFHHTSGEGIVQEKPGLLSWIPDDAGVFVKMTYAGSKEALKMALPGLAADIQASATEDLEYEGSVRPKVFKRL